MKTSIALAFALAAGGCTGPSSATKTTQVTPPASTTEQILSPATAKSVSPALHSITGMARDVKGGAAVIDDQGHPTRIDGLDQWPKNLVDRRVVVEGRLKTLEGPECASDKVMPCQGIPGEYTVLTDATYRLE